MNAPKRCTNCGRPIDPAPSVDGALLVIVDGVLQCGCLAAMKADREKYLAEKLHYAESLRFACWDAISTLHASAVACLAEALQRLNEQRWDEGAQLAVWEQFDGMKHSLENAEHLEAVQLATHGKDAIARVLRLVRK